MKSQERPLAMLHSVRAHAFQQPLQYSRRHDHLSDKKSRGWVEQRVPVRGREGISDNCVRAPPKIYHEAFDKRGVWKQYIMLQAALRGGLGHDSGVQLGMWICLRIGAWPPGAWGLCLPPTPISADWKPLNATNRIGALGPRSRDPERRVRSSKVRDEEPRGRGTGPLA